MKKALSFFFLFIILFKAESQSLFFSDAFANEKWKADSLYKLNQFKEAGHFYERACKQQAVNRFKRLCYFNAAMCFKQLGNKEKAISNLKNSVIAGLRFSSIATLKADTNLNYFRTSAHWEVIEQELIANTDKYLKIDSAKRAILLVQYEKDQLYRVRPQSLKDSLTNIYGKDLIDSVMLKRLFETDKENKVFIAEMISKNGWPGTTQVGDYGDMATWAIVQHADDDIPFQKECLKLIEVAIKEDNTRLRSYPYLVDRIAINENRKQIYGTQFRINDANKLNILPLEKPEMVDKYRNCFGLETLDEYVKFAKGRYKAN